MNRLELWPDEMTAGDGLCRVGAAIEGPSDSDYLWYQTDQRFQDWLSTDCDPFVIAMLFYAMQRRADLVVHGCVSSSLLANLEEFQDAWVLKRPDAYGKIEIIADKESERAPAAEGSAVLAFSGGVDSTFTVLRHRLDRCGRLRRNIDTGLMVHGFDIALEEAEAFGRAFKRAKSTLEVIDLPLISLSTNHRHLNPEWDFTHILGLASALSLFKGRFSLGVIAGTLHYAEDDLAWGSSVATDRLLSSASFEILHDGAAFTRVDKIREISAHPFAYDALRLCYSAANQDENCCRCWKCIINILRFRILGLKLPASFLSGVTDEQILSMDGLGEIGVLSLKNVLRQARQHGHEGSWVLALEECIRRNEERASASAPDMAQIGFRKGLIAHLKVMCGKLTMIAGRSEGH